MAIGVEPAEKNRELELRILDRLFGEAGDTDVGVQLWDGTCWPDDKPRKATLVLHHPGSLRAMFIGGDELSLAEAYLYDDFDIKGDIEAVFRLGDILVERTNGWHKKLPMANLLLQLPKDQEGDRSGKRPAELTGRRHSTTRDRHAVTYHYNVSNDFYAQFLDPDMVYSCAYFENPGENLATAQKRKLDYICRKLRLHEGQHLLDIGCGWGGLAIHAALNYGVDVTGITLSQPQVDLGNSRIRAAGLSDRVHLRVQDYRELAEDEGPFDALVSVGMFEHVGKENLLLYFRHASGLLAPGGVFLNHGIACPFGEKPSARPDFSNTYVFPDGELVTIGETIAIAESAGFEVRDVESLREHYMLTLRHWVHRLEANREQALRFVDEPTYRIWRLYMSGSAHSFQKGIRSVYQTLLVKPDAQGRSGLPLMRADWYGAFTS